MNWKNLKQWCSEKKQKIKGSIKKNWENSKKKNRWNNKVRTRIKNTRSD